MKLLRSFAIAATVGLVLTVGAGVARAGDKGCKSCGHGFGGHAVPQPNTLFHGSLFDRLSGLKQPKLPVFQAAPWYQYWPYDGHFLTPAPVTGAFYGPPLPGNFPVNPYFPGPAYPVMPPPGFGPPPGGGR